MGKKASKPNIDKIVEKVNKEFEKTSSQIEKMINDALKQFDGVQNQIQEPVKKLLKEMEELREREVKRFSDEFDRRMSEFNELQDSVLERLGMSKKKASGAKKKTGGSAAKKSAAKKPAAKKAVAKKAPAKKPAAAKKSPATKPAAKKAAPKKAATKPSAKTPVNKSDLTQIKGIGPATAKKMKEAGITSIDQVANPSAEDKDKLKAFSNVKGFSTFSAEAKKVL